MQTDMVVGPRVLHLPGSRKSIKSHTEGSLNKRDLKAHLHSDTLPPTRSLIMSFPLGAIFFQTTTGRVLFENHLLQGG